MRPVAVEFVGEGVDEQAVPVEVGGDLPASEGSRMAGQAAPSHLHYTPTSASWLNQVERWFAVISQRAIRQESFDSVPHLVRTIKSFIAECNEAASPFAWHATADSILEKLERLSMRICGTQH